MHTIRLRLDIFNLYPSELLRSYRQSGGAVLCVSELGSRREIVRNVVGLIAIIEQIESNIQDEVLERMR